MGIALGNFTIKELGEKHGFTLTDEHGSTLEAMRQNNAQHIEKVKLPHTIIINLQEC